MGSVSSAKITKGSCVASGEETDDNGPITRAAKNTDAGGGALMPAPGESRGDQQQEGNLLKGGPAAAAVEPLVSIVGGAATALVVVVVIVVVIVRARCRRVSGAGETTWRKDNSDSSFETGGSTSPDLLVKNIPGEALGGGQFRKF